ncbi:MAG: hypothetical protein AVDCRST_MAG86-155, partial [uncultured Truepera sp.]
GRFRKSERHAMTLIVTVCRSSLLTPLQDVTFCHSMTRHIA